VLACRRIKGSPSVGSTILSQAVKHHWYGDTSPWTERRSEAHYGFDRPEQPIASKAVILDGDNPPQTRSGRTLADYGAANPWPRSTP
jgi:hypothetical protein